jgi:hypothetical protein
MHKALESMTHDQKVAVADMLLTLWDPAGVNGVPQARDEYDT